MPERTQRLAHMALVVREYDEAIEFYADKLGFELLEDTDLGGEKRWVRVAPPGGGGAALLLARASGQNSRPDREPGRREGLPVPRNG
jgi:catechol 2,3-dioxygenase-like lactoylglutathione lyase family enzyme